jgi:predicted SAM-dependent methyltransferase
VTCWPVMCGRKIKIIVGAAETHQNGWYSTNEQWLDITKTSDWQLVFKGKKNISHVVAEHVFKHLTYSECKKALTTINQVMIYGGRLRIAVPDGYHPDSDYIRHVGINGLGDDAKDHKQLLNVDLLIELLESAGFECYHLEGYKADGQLVENVFSFMDVFIRRTRTNIFPND